MIADLATLAVCCAALAVILCTRTGRDHLWRWTRDILLSLRFVLWELPLRAITGRRRPDYARIASLQRTVDLPLADLIAKAEWGAEQEMAGGGWQVKGLFQSHGKCYEDGQEITAAEYEARARAALTLVSAGCDPADVLATVGVPAATRAPKPERGTLGGMRPGDVCWAVPWALSAHGFRLWLDAGYLAGRAPGGTATVRVERRPDGYHAWSEPGEEVYVNEAVRPGKNSGRHYLPVTWHSGYPGVRVRVIELEPKRMRR